MILKNIIKYFPSLILLLMIFSLVACQNRNMKGGLMHPDMLLDEYPWLLGQVTLTSQLQIDSIRNHTSFSLKLSDVVLNTPKVKIKYFYGQYEEPYKDKYFILTADNGKSFTAGELLFKINNETVIDLKNDPHYYFEGLMYDGIEDNIPVYEIAQGS